MANQPASDDLRSVWQNQTSAPVKLSSDRLRRESRKLERRVFWRNGREYLGCAFVVVAFGYYFWKFQAPLMRAGSGLTIAGALYVAYQLHRKGSAKAPPMDLPLAEFIEFHRAELERQRRMLRSVWWWYLLPFVPGLALFVIGTGQPAVQTVLALAGAGAVFFAVWKLNQWAAGALQREIRSLDEWAARKIQPEIDSIVALGKGSKWYSRWWR